MPRLSGHWREDHLFSLQQALQMYDAVQERIAVYEKEILRKLGEMEREQQRGQTAPPLPNASKARSIKKRGPEAKRQALYRMSGVDITQVDVLGVETVEVVLSEYGPDLSRFSTEKEFVSHTTLAPHVAKSGGKPLRRKSGTARAPGSRLLYEWPRFRSAEARLLGESTIAESHNAWVEMWRCSLPPGSWPF